MKAADVIVGYTTYIDLIKDIFPDKNFLNTPMTREVERCRIALEEAKKGQQVALISSGDSGIYGMAGIMLQVGRGYTGTYHSGSDGGQRRSVHAWRTADE